MPQDAIFVYPGAKELNEKSSQTGGIQDIKILKRTYKLKNTESQIIIQFPAVKGFACVSFPSTSN